MNIQVYAQATHTDLENQSVTLTGVDLNQLVAEINVNELLEAIKANDLADEIISWSIKELQR